MYSDADQLFAGSDLDDFGNESTKYEECADCGSTGHDTGSDTCPGPDVQDRLEDPNRQEVK